MPRDMPTTIISRPGIDTNGACYGKGKIIVSLENLKTGGTDRVELVPIGKTVLRQAAF